MGCHSSIHRKHCPRCWTETRHPGTRAVAHCIVGMAATSEQCCSIQCSLLYDCTPQAMAAKQNAGGADGKRDTAAAQQAQQQAAAAAAQQAMQAQVSKRRG